MQIPRPHPLILGEQWISFPWLSLIPPTILDTLKFSCSQMLRSVTESAAAEVMYMASSVLLSVHNFSCHILWQVPCTLLVFKFVIWHLHYTCIWVEFTIPCNKNLIPRPKLEQFLLYPYGAKINQKWGWNITPMHLGRATISQHCVSPERCSRRYITDTSWAMTSVAHSCVTTTAVTCCQGLNSDVCNEINEQKYQASRT